MLDYKDCILRRKAATGAVTSGHLAAQNAIDKAQ